MKVALGQFAVEREWRHNLATCLRLMHEANAAAADLLVLPEAVLARDNRDPDWGVNAAQPLDGPFISQLRAASAEIDLTLALTLHTPAGPGRVFNTLVVLRRGELLTHYHKLHLYDAFAMQESRRVTPGCEVPALVDVAGMKIGLMTCYDVRFPELARRLALDGAQVLVVPAAWLRGPLKEAHWEILLSARALDNTCYVVASGECGEKNIGSSMAVDPLGVVLARAAEVPALIFAQLDEERLNHARRQLPVLENRRFESPQLKR
ncbi:deaminated glutathione amidase [Affinibrenneria salicis]|uniref:Deaminated glutathione amidase n=1 Tax=Affinibrenneria salicis TaxID=2590031 RepID=A0A5J5G0C2_9GAMM|nr:deaminated glutathione amidase [Affinibrenneria salicis]KAA8999959.1 deaminated glutathione amidase [Affinibrenneria salicis]